VRTPSASLSDKQPARIAGMFDAIAPRYDALNHLLSAGLDRGWRRRAVRALELTGRERVLDMCTGTADLAIEAVAGRFGRAREVVGIDFAAGMLHLGREKVRQRGLGGAIHLARGDATRAPLADRSCDAALIAFGIRNVADIPAACREFARVLRPGGRLAILEFGTPAIPGLRGLYAWYFRHVLPRVGRLVSRHRDAYSYLPASVAQFPSPDAFMAVVRAAGFRSISHSPLTLGIVSLFVAER
jgi:demethylmenaquinone methyltransferase / 2-methoxy-6-polyprenyl-1,4-benzoquinol methylase